MRFLALAFVAMVGLVPIAAELHASYPWIPPSRQGVCFIVGSSMPSSMSGSNAASLEKFAKFVVAVEANVVIEARSDLAEADPLAASRARGEAIKSVFVRLGLPDGNIIVKSLGGTRPIVPYRQGIIDPQNLCAEIIVGKWHRRPPGQPYASQASNWYERECDPVRPGPDSAECGNARPAYGGR